jgi:two-component sensor histidine kinase
MVAAEDRIKSLLREKDLILKEAHHRIKNNMGTVSSLLSLQAAGHESSSCKVILEEAANRIQGMMLLYDRLYHAGGLDDLSVGEFLPQLVRQISDVFDKSSRVRTVVEAEDFTMCARALSAVGIIINELITNSMKYAFMAKEEGLIRVTATKEGSVATVVYEDDGPGLPDGVGFDNSAGFGMKLVSMLAEQAGGSIRIERGGGARFVLELAV